MKLTGRKAHILFARTAIAYLGRKRRLPTSRMVAMVADVHPSTARRWLADLRQVLPARVSAFRQGLGPVSAQPTRREAAAGLRKRTVRECCAEIETGAAALSDLAHGWLVFLSTPSALAGPEATAHGLLRLVAELRQACTNANGT
ncbi:MAG TPA: hypothetical protein VFI49_08105 [Rudaea sp.]|nr:hypothetical protein [Rudaea sp.]